LCLCIPPVFADTSTSTGLPQLEFTQVKSELNPVTNQVMVKFGVSNKTAQTVTGITVAGILEYSDTANLVEEDIARTTLPTSYSFAVNESKNLNMNIPVPAAINDGEYYVVLRAYNQTGIPLASSAAPAVVASGTNRFLSFNWKESHLTVDGKTNTALGQNLTAPGISPKADFTVHNRHDTDITVTPQIKVYERFLTAGSQPVSTQKGNSVVVPAKGQTTITLDLPAQSTPEMYYAVVELTDSTGAIVSPFAQFQYVVPGASGRILSSSGTISRTLFSSVAAIRFSVVGRVDGGTLDGAKIKLTVTDPKNNGKTITTVVQPIGQIGPEPITVSIPVTIRAYAFRKLDAVSITAVLLDKDGKTLDQNNMPLNLQVGQPPFWWYLVLPLVIILVFLAVVILRMMRQKRTAPLPVPGTTLLLIIGIGILGLLSALFIQQSAAQAGSCSPNVNCTPTTMECYSIGKYSGCTCAEYCASSWSDPNPDPLKYTQFSLNPSPAGYTANPLSKVNITGTYSVYPYSTAVILYPNVNISVSDAGDNLGSCISQPGPVSYSSTGWSAKADVNKVGNAQVVQTVTADVNTTCLSCTNQSKTSIQNTYSCTCSTCVYDDVTKEEIDKKQKVANDVPLIHKTDVDGWNAQSGTAYNFDDKSTFNDNNYDTWDWISNGIYGMHLGGYLPHPMSITKIVIKMGPPPAPNITGNVGTLSSPQWTNGIYLFAGNNPRIPSTGPDSVLADGECLIGSLQGMGIKYDNNTYEYTLPHPIMASYVVIRKYFDSTPVDFNIAEMRVFATDTDASVANLCPNASNGGGNGSTPNPPPPPPPSSTPPACTYNSCQPNTRITSCQDVMNNIGDFENLVAANTYQWNTITNEWGSLLPGCGVSSDGKYIVVNVTANTCTTEACGIQSVPAPIPTASVEPTVLPTSSTRPTPWATIVPQTASPMTMRSTSRALAAIVTGPIDPGTPTPESTASPALTAPTTDNPGTPTPDSTASPASTPVAGLCTQGGSVWNKYINYVGAETPVTAAIKTSTRPPDAGTIFSVYSLLFQISPGDYCRIQDPSCACSSNGSTPNPPPPSSGGGNGNDGNGYSSSSAPWFNYGVQ
jgi:hypothetical protein